MSKFTHLHVHSEYSVLDGMAAIPDIVAAAKADGQTAIALTDHGRMSGFPEFYQECHKADIKPIPGQEFYICLDVTDRTRHPDPITGKKGPPPLYHMVLLARDRRGYEILCELSSIANSPECFYYKPRIDYSILEQLGKKARRHLIASTTCTSGHVPVLFEEGKRDEAVAQLRYLRELFPYMYCELQRHVPDRDPKSRKHWEIQENLNAFLIRNANRYDLPVCITNDCHYPIASYHTTHDLWLAIQTAADFRTTERFRFSGSGYHIATTRELKRRWADAKSVWRVSQQCISELVASIECVLPELENRVWHIPTAPRENKEIPSPVYMRKYCQTRLKELETSGRLAADISTYRNRLRYELSIIFGAQFEEEFLIVKDYIDWARSRGIRVGPGRGSMAGVLAAYLMGIVDTDPIRYDLMFERALNPARPSLPDFDVDFPRSRREEVIAYLLDRYNQPPYKAQQVGTFGRLGPRGTVQNILRSLGFPPPQVNAASKSLPDSAAITNLKASGELEEILAEENRGELHPILRDAMEAYPSFVEWATRIQGMVSGEGKHAAGVVITDERFDLGKIVPTMMVGRGQGRGQQAVVTQYDMNALKKLGVVKFDILSLDTLDVIQEVCEAIGQDPFVEMAEYEDPKVWETINSGACSGIFQVEGGASRQVVRDLQLKSFEDLIAVMALGRSGANQFVVPYREGRDSGTKVLRQSLPDKRLLPILPRGVVLYQEQVMEIGLVIAGMDHHVVDELKEAIKYKKGDIWEELKPIFFEGGDYKGGHCVGALHNGCTLEVAQQIWDMIYNYRGYGFNRAHATCYAMIAYQTAWLKTHYPAQFYAALLSHKPKEARPIIIDEAKSHFGIRFLPPDVNQSGLGFTVVGKRRIRYGLSSIKGVGAVACQELLERKPFFCLADLEETVTRRKCNSRVIETLRRVGALESVGALADPNRAATELELLGAYVTAHPIDKYRKNIDKRVRQSSNLRWLERDITKDLWVGGIITRVKEITTRGGRSMAFVELTYDRLGKWDVVVFPDVWERYKPSLYRNRAVCVYGKYQHDKGSVILQTLELPGKAA